MVLQIILNCRGDLRSPAGVQNFGSAEIYAPTVWRFESARGLGSVEFIIKNAFRPSEKLPYFFTPTLAWDIHILPITLPKIPPS